MTTYIYFVKCPNCEDEHFDFFDEAKEFALGCLSQKPIITQTEVCRNDFGECTDSADLGTVWSWEDIMKDTEPDGTVFSKDETFGISEGLDDFDDFDIGPQIDEFDNSLDFDDVSIETLWVAENLNGGEIVAACWADSEDLAHRLLSRAFRERTGGDLRDCYIREAEADEPDYIANNPELLAEAEHPEDFEESCRKPIPEGMTIEQLVEEMEENEDTVECTLCQDLFDKSECRKELNLGWLCRRCADDLTARGEGPVFKEDNYWDFFDEDAELHDLGNEYDGGYPATQTWVCYFDGVDIGTVEAATEDEALEKMQREYPEYPYGLRHEVDIWVEPADDSLFESVLTEAAGYDCPKLREAENNQQGIAKFKILFQFRRDPTVQGAYGDCPYLSGMGSDVTFKNVNLIDVTRRSYGTVKDIALSDTGEVMLTTHEGKKYSLRQALKIASTGTLKFSNTRTVLLAIKKAAETAEKTLDTKTVRNLRVRNALGKLDDTIANEFKAAITNIVFRIPSHNAYSAEDILDIDPDASEAIAEKAAEKINKIHDDFYGLPFVSANKDQMESSGMIEERVPAEKAAWINSSWGAVGKIYFDRPINQLSVDAQKIIANAKLSDAKVDPKADSVDCYRLATELIRFFGNDPWFYTKPVESDDDVETAEPEVADEAFDLDFPEV